MAANIGSVLLRKQDNYSLLPSFITSACLFVLSIVLFSARANDSTSRYLQPLRPPPILDLRNATSLHVEDRGVLSLDLDSSFVLVPPQSVTVILPILSQSLWMTQDLLEPFFQPLERVCEVIIICPDAIASDVRRMLQKTYASLGSDDHPDVSLRPWQGYMDLQKATLKASKDVVSGWALILDESGLSELSQPMRILLLNPPNVSLPLGPKGVSHQGRIPSRHFGPGQAKPVSYLYPPFLVPSSLLVPFGTVAPTTWADLGERITQGRSDNSGGLMISIDTTDVPVPKALPVTESSPSIPDLSIPNNWKFNTSITIPAGASGRFVFLMPSRNDMRAVAPLICRMKAKSKYVLIRVLIYGDGYANSSNHTAWEGELFETYRCNFKYDVLARPLLSFSNGSAIPSQWLLASAMVDVVLTLAEPDYLVASISSSLSIMTPLRGATHIRIPRIDLANTEWMSALTLEEWKNWHRPRIDISIITKDRPAALMRLLASLEKAPYFGEQIDLRINVEQDCDAASLRIAENISWPHGRVFVHRRVVHGGLLPAVVESWYPQDNHSYGVLLEDDIEVSPLYYAWLKMSVLRYRYGAPENQSPHMFGISLYQQKHLELPMEGRQAFNPRALFAQMGIPHPLTPYLSSVPCSWGAIYFPEHWREFHNYLAERLAETVLTIEEDVVPAVRSNHWSKSWKKFFIELVYLRGYVMLYPNYEDFVSLSTNHLEVGSHVKDRSAEKQDLFKLPLMRLQKPQESSKLLDLPHGTLPPLSALPVLNLTGYLTSQDQLVAQGQARQAELANLHTSFFDT